MIQKAILVSIYLLALSCGDNNKGHKAKTNNGNNPTEIDDSESSDAYFNLARNCDLTGGKAIIGGKCVPTKITLSIDGMVSYGSAISEERIFSGGIGVVPQYQFPYRKIRTGSKNGYEFPMTVPPENHTFEHNSLSASVMGETPDEVSSWIHLGTGAVFHNRFQIDLDIFNQKATAEEQTKANLPTICERFYSEFKSRHPLFNETTFFLSDLDDAQGYQCMINTPGQKFLGELEPFHYMNLTWQCDDDICYFKSLFLN